MPFTYFAHDIIAIMIYLALPLRDIFAVTPRKGGD